MQNALRFAGIIYSLLFRVYFSSSAPQCYCGGKEGLFSSRFCQNQTWGGETSQLLVWFCGGVFNWGNATNMRGPMRVRGRVTELSAKNGKSAHPSSSRRRDCSAVYIHIAQTQTHTQIFFILSTVPFRKGNPKNNQRTLGINKNTNGDSGEEKYHFRLATTPFSFSTEVWKLFPDEREGHGWRPQQGAACVFRLFFLCLTATEQI